VRKSPLGHRIAAERTAGHHDDQRLPQTDCNVPGDVARHEVGRLRLHTIGYVARLYKEFKWSTRRIDLAVCAWMWWEGVSFPPGTDRASASELFPLCNSRNGANN
jgi:hypothetical protein